MSGDIIKDLLHKVAGIEGPTAGAFSLRVNGKSVGMASSPNVSITPKKDGNGIDIRIKPGTRGEVVHIPVVLAKGGIADIVGNDFYIGDDCEDILIVAGCGVHGDGCGHARHDGVHTFHVGKNARLVYKETHYGSGEIGEGRIMNPTTNIYLEQDACFEMESVQIEGIDSTNRVTKAALAANSTLTISEKLMTSGVQSARTEFALSIDGDGAKASLVSRSVAKGNSYQEFISRIAGNCECVGRSECDAILMDNGTVKAVPEVTATHVGASLTHEAAIGRIAGEQLVKLMTLGLTEQEAETHIINGFLK